MRQTTSRHWSAAATRCSRWAAPGRRERRLPVLRILVALLGRHGLVGPDTHRLDRDLVVAQCLAMATRHGLDMMGYRCRDGQSGPGAGAPADGLFPDGASERAFLAEVSGRDHGALGRMARDAVIPGPERMTLA